MRLVILWLAMLAALVTFVMCDPAQPLAKMAGVRTLERAELRIGDVAGAQRGDWQAVSLPDNWRERRPGISGIAWYRVRFEIDSALAQPLALYLPRLAIAGELRLNEALLTPPAPFDAAGAPLRQAVDVPVYLVLPPSAFHAGTNELRIRMQADANVRSGLSAVRLGPVALLEPVWQRQYLLQTVLPYALAILLCAAMCLAWAYAHKRRQDGVFASALAVGALSLALDMVPSLPLTLGDRHAVRALVYATALWLLCRAALHMSDAQPRVLRRLFNTVWAVTMLAIVVQIVLRQAGDMVWALLLPFVVTLTLAAALVLDSAWRQRSVRLGLLGLASFVFCASLAQTCVLPMGWLPWDSFRYNAAATIPLCTMLLVFFGERFVLEREETAREKRTAVAKERTRILQDMHDGMGGLLVTAKRMALRPEVDRNDVAQVIDESLQDLRLIIDSLEAPQSDVMALLGNLRFRLQPRLAAVGIALRWNAPQVPSLEGLPPTDALAILRIVQECINNALRHAQPKELRLVVSPEVTHVLIQVIDDGLGFEQTSASVGRGLSFMRARAASLGALLCIDTRQGGGTTVSLRVPKSKSRS